MKKLLGFALVPLLLCSCDLFADWSYSRVVDNKFDLLIHWNEEEKETVHVDVAQLQQDLYLVDIPKVEGMYFVACYTKPDGQGKALINYLGEYLLASKEPEYQTEECYAYYLPMEPLTLAGSASSSTDQKIGSNSTNWAEYPFRVSKFFQEADYYAMAKFWQYVPETISLSLTAPLSKSNMSSAEGVRIEMGFSDINEEEYEAGDTITVSPVKSPNGLVFSVPGEMVKLHYKRGDNLVCRFVLIGGNAFANYKVSGVDISMEAVLGAE